VRRNSWTFWTAWIFALALMLVLACVEKARRVFPMNMILLGAFTVAQAWLVGILSAHYNESAVLLAFAVTAAAVLAISIFAINTKIDVTRWGTLLLVALVAFIVLLLFGIFLRSKIFHLVIAGIACLLFSAYLIYDIQVGAMSGLCWWCSCDSCGDRAGGPSGVPLHPCQAGWLQQWQ
jgi:FtsH-binding integral membrane protein